MEVTQRAACTEDLPERNAMISFFAKCYGLRLNRSLMLELVLSSRSWASFVARMQAGHRKPTRGPV